MTVAILQEIGAQDVGSPSHAETLAATTEELNAAAARTPVNPALESMKSFETLPYTPNQKQSLHMSPDAPGPTFIDLDMESPGSDVLVRHESEMPDVPEPPQVFTPDVAGTGAPTESKHMQPPDGNSVTSHQHGAQAKEMAPKINYVCYFTDFGEHLALLLAMNKAVDDCLCANSGSCI